jgi:hypothetical protein
VFAQQPGPLPGWFDADIGAVGQRGSSRQSDDTFHLAGAGSDIWGTSDSFHYVYVPIDANAHVAVKVTSESATHPYAKAGVMLRQSLDPSAATVIFDAKPDGGTELMMRPAAGANMFFMRGTTGTLPVWLHLVRMGQNIAAFTSSQACSMGCGDWTMVSNGWVPWVAGPALIGLAVTSHDPTVLNQATLDFWQGGTLPAPWLQNNLFPTSQLYFATMGSAAFGGSPGTITVPSAGTDIWGTVDSFTEVAQSVRPGDATLIARVIGMNFPNPFAKAGVMMRVSANPSVASVVLDVKPDGGIEFMARPTYRAETAFLAGASASFPVWLKLVKTDDQISGYWSSDGNAWTSVGTTFVSLTPSGATFDAALAVTAHDSSAPPWEGAGFDNVSLSASTATNLLFDSGFEADSPPAFSSPGWASDRQIAAVSETQEPRTGLKNGACRQTTSADCGLFQDIVAPTSGTFTVTLYANADRPGVLVGANVNGAGVASRNVEVRGAGNYGAPYTFTLAANLGDTIRVWLYSPATPGSAVIDDVSLAFTPQ